ncbi:hypothetical protein NPIL_188601 [Nephila pilipes]|uniref:Uncharacterized protein n=1 Tax=Nephila pilipes TaxID=299642 RepID=A0A8X6U1G6_NEPPI|nr:hypothetical protein NPIL_188601 [Nephila pilipes]
MSLENTDFYCKNRIIKFPLVVWADPSSSLSSRSGLVYRGSRAKGVGLCSRNLTGGRLTDGCASLTQPGYILRNRNSNPEEKKGGHHLPIITYSLRLLQSDAIKSTAFTTTNRLQRMTPQLAIHLADLSADGQICLSL